MSLKQIKLFKFGFSNAPLQDKQPEIPCKVQCGFNTCKDKLMAVLNLKLRVLLVNRTVLYIPFTQKAHHRITERSGLEVTLKPMYSNPPTLVRDISHQTRMFKDPAKLSLSTSREEASRASLGAIFQCLTTHS